MTHEPQDTPDIPRSAAPALLAAAAPITSSPFTMRFSSTLRGARLARRMTENVLDAWGVPYGSEPHDELILVVAELCANAAQHGCVPGRDFELRLSLTTDEGSSAVQVEVTDTVAERVPSPRPLTGTADDPAESGWGLLLVAEFAADWGWHPRPDDDGPGKTVWARYTLPAVTETPEGPRTRRP